MQEFPAGVDRLDLHNAGVDQWVASAQLCGVIDLRSGRVCVLGLRHGGPL
ncbi:MAG: hypothetical protein ACYCS2_03995 [Acidimicrobiales bacterium]